MRRQLVASGAAVATALAVGVAVSALPAIAIHVDPILLDQDNPTCAGEAPEGETWLELKVDPVPDEEGTFTSDDGLLEVTITITGSNDEDEPTVFDWTSNIGVDAVVAKGSNAGNLYLYDPEATADTGLHAPDAGGSEEPAGLSHISFCYDVGDETTPPTTAPETPPETPPTTPPTEKPETPAPVPTEVPAGTNTGGSDSLGLWGLIAGSCAAVAGAAVVVRRRFLHDS